MFLRRILKCRNTLPRLTYVKRSSGTSTNILDATCDKDKWKNVEFETVYKFPYIRHFALLNKIKNVTAIASAIMIPSCAALAITGNLTMDALYISSYLGISGTVAFSLVSLFSKNLIGFLYLSKDNKYLKISYLDFWARRKDIIVQVDDWIPLTELPFKTQDVLYRSPRLISEPIQLKMITKLGGVTDKSRFGVYIE